MNADKTTGYITSPMAITTGTAESFDEAGRADWGGRALREFFVAGCGDRGAFNPV
jgi:hypothetical protein